MRAWKHQGQGYLLKSCQSPLPPQRRRYRNLPFPEHNHKRHHAHLTNAHLFSPFQNSILEPVLIDSLSLALCTLRCHVKFNNTSSLCTNAFSALLLSLQLHRIPFQLKLRNTYIPFLDILGLCAAPQAPHAHFIDRYLGASDHSSAPATLHTVIR